MDHSIRKGDDRENSFGAWFRLEQLSTISVAHVVRNYCCVRAFCNALAWLRCCFNFNRLQQNEEVPKYRYGREIVE